MLFVDYGHANGTFFFFIFYQYKIKIICLIYINIDCNSIEMQIYYVLTCHEHEQLVHLEKKNESFLLLNFYILS